MKMYLLLVSLCAVFSNTVFAETATAPTIQAE